MIPNKFNIDSVLISQAAYDEIVKHISIAIQEKKQTIITYVNHHIFNICKRDEKFKKIINESDIAHVDGVGVWFASRILGNNKVNRFNWTDCGFKFLLLCEEKQWRIFFLGSRFEVLQLFLNNIKSVYPKLIVAGFVDGYEGVKDKNLVDTINLSNADILWVGMGSPKQEIWIKKNYEKLTVLVIQAVGGIFDHIACKRIRAPKLIQNLGLEWFIRVLYDPKTYFKRYFFGGFIFIYKIAVLKIKKYFNIKKVKD